MMDGDPNLGMPYKDPEKQKQVQRDWVKERRHRFLSALGGCEVCHSKEPKLWLVRQDPDAAKPNWSKSLPELYEVVKGYRILCTRHRELGRQKYKHLWKANRDSYFPSDKELEWDLIKASRELSQFLRMVFGLDYKQLTVQDIENLYAKYLESTSKEPEKRFQD